MITSPYSYLETPSLLIDNDIALANIAMMQKKVDSLGLKLRPHIKTHRMPYFAKLQMEAGACGITVFKVHFEAVQGEINKMLTCIDGVEESEGKEEADKLRKALQSLCQSVQDNL